MGEAQQNRAGARPTGAMGVSKATAIGIGGMMGAAPYTLIGLAAGVAGVWVPLAFVVGGIVALFSVYSYAKLGVTFPSRGGAAKFLIRCFGDGVLAGGLNVFQYLGWIITIALYAVGFAEYFRQLFGIDDAWTNKVIGVVIILAIMAINTISARLVGSAQLVFIAVEIAILVAFVIVGFIHADPAHFSIADGSGEGWIGIFLAAGLLYVTYEGFGVVTNSAGDMSDPRRQLPRAMYQSLAVAMVSYVVVSSVIILVLDPSTITANEGHVLATAAAEIMGKAGLIIIGVAALLASVSGINATLYGDANLAFLVARRHELPGGLAYGFWRNGTVGLLVAAGIACAFVIFFPLAAVGQLASLAFLLVYGSVSVGHLRVRRQTGGKTAILVIAILLNIALFALLFGYIVRKGETTTWVTLLAVLALSFGIEWAYRRLTGSSLARSGVDDASGGDPGAGSAPPVPQERSG